MSSDIAVEKKMNMFRKVSMERIIERRLGRTNCDRQERETKAKN